MNDQRSTTDQLRDAVGVLNREGLYDAADFCRREVERVDRLLAPETRPIAEQHATMSAPGFQYATTQGQRKCWDRQNIPPDGEGWDRNTDAGGGEGWERFEFHEESYWRRARP